MCRLGRRGSDKKRVWAWEVWCSVAIPRFLEPSVFFIFLVDQDIHGAVGGGRLKVN